MRISTKLNDAERRARIKASLKNNNQGNKIDTTKIKLQKGFTLKSISNANLSRFVESKEEE